MPNSFLKPATIADMAKSSSQFVCKNCGSSFASWFGKCPDCSEWNSLTEFKTGVETDKSAPHSYTSQYPSEFVFLDKVSKESVATERHSSGFAEVDRVLGGGFVNDEVVLLSGEPGVGKSTLLLSILGRKKEADSVVVYVSTEEESRQISSRAKRMGADTSHILFASDKNIDDLLTGLEKALSSSKVSLIIFDSLQGFYTVKNETMPGSMAQSKEVLMRIVEFCKRHHVTAIVVGHVTKEGDVAGPKFLEHMVDAVLFLEGEKMTNLRLLRSFKNRFGPTDEVGFLEMTGSGLVEVINPSSYFLDLEAESMGKAVIGVRQGLRIVFATVESLVVGTTMAFPKRVAKGIDSKRLELILAILKKYLKLPVDNFDIYVNISGGLRVDDPLADLGIAASVYSSLVNKAFSARELFVGEVGLLGAVRATNTLSAITKEAKRLGFTKIHSPTDTSHIRLLGTQLK